MFAESFVRRLCHIYPFADLPEWGSELWQTACCGGVEHSGFPFTTARGGSTSIRVASVLAMAGSISSGPLSGLEQLPRDTMSSSRLARSLPSAPSHVTRLPPQLASEPQLYFHR